MLAARRDDDDDEIVKVGVGNIHELNFRLELVSRIMIQLCKIVFIVEDGL